MIRRSGFRKAALFGALYVALIGAGRMRGSKHPRQDSYGRTRGTAAQRPPRTTRGS